MAPAKKPYEYVVPQGSVLYTEVLSPYVYAPVAELYPRWLHPNVLTLGGMLSAWVSFAVVAAYSPDLAGDADNWVYIVSGIFFGLYILFDNTDGKQARRAGLSSAAGETFDHGVDVTVTTLGMLVVSDAIGMPPSMVVMQLLSAHVTTYVNNWHHKITGHMSWGGRYLSVDEATLVTMSIILCAGIFGTSLYTQNLLTDDGWNPWRPRDPSAGPLAFGTMRWDSAEWGPITFGDSLAMFSWSYSAIDTVQKLFTTLARRDDTEGSGRTLKDAITSLLPIIVHVGLAIWLFYSCAPVDPITIGLVTGCTFSCIGLRLVVSMKFAPESVEYRLHTLTVVASVCAGCAVATTEECSSRMVLGGDQWVVAVVGLLYATHLLAFGHALYKINEGRPLFTAPPKAD